MMFVAVVVLGLSSLAMLGLDLLPNVETDVEQDRDHVKSLAFSRFGPWSFTLFWTAALLWTGARYFLGF